MKIAIIAAMDKEVSLLLELMPDYHTEYVDNITVYVGKIGGKEVYLSKCGIGKVNAAINTYKIIEYYHPDLIINSGVAGGVDDSAGIGSVLIADRVAYHDVWCGPGTEYGAADGLGQYIMPSQPLMERLRESLGNREGIHFGLLASGDKFISKAEEVAEIKSHFADALGCDMESGAIGQVANQNGIPFIVVRVLSDRPGSGDNVAQYQNFWSDAPKLTFDVVREVINDSDK